MSQLSFSDAEYAGKRKKTRREVFLEALVLDRDLPEAGVGVAHAAVARREHAVEEIDTRPDRRQEVGRCSDSHEVARAVLRHT